MTILVTGATGNIGRHVVRELHERGADVRALVRNPDTAHLPAGVKAVRGDLTTPDSFTEALAGVEAVFLLWPTGQTTPEQEAAFVSAAARHARHIVYVSSAGAGDADDPINDDHGRVERLIEGSGLTWTFLRPVGIAVNALWWAKEVRATGTVSSAFPDLARPLVHEADIAAVAVRTLTEPGHAGQAYVLSGPARVSEVEQVRLIGEAIGRPVRFVEISIEEARKRASVDLPADLASAIIDAHAQMVHDPEPVTTTVRDITDHPPRTFAQWAADHAADFR